MLRVPRGLRGSLATARLIGRLIQAGARDFCVRQTALRVFRTYGVPPKDYLGEVRALFDWVRRHVRYTRDIRGVELLHGAFRVMQTGAGDCDDFTILLGALLMSTGHPVRLVLAGYRPHRPHAYSHIYPEVHVGGRWVALDATMPFPMGWSTPALWKRVCEISKEGLACSLKTR